jgi:hypothetical protein
LFIVNISLPEAVEKALDTRTSMGVIGNMDTFQQYQMGQAMTAAAENPAGGGAADGMGLGMGLAMASRMMPGQGAPAAGMPMAGGTPPPPPPVVQWHVADNGQTLGPYRMEQLVAAISSGEVKQGTMVWTAAIGGWTAAGQVPQLAAYFHAATPPPPPPAS